MAEDNKYSIYGDDDRENSENLEDMSKTVEDLLSTADRKRRKSRRKPQNAELEDLEDLEQPAENTTDQLGGSSEESADQAFVKDVTKTPDSTETKPAETKPEEQEEDPKKKPNGALIVIILVVILVVVLVLVGLMKNAVSDSGAAQNKLNVHSGTAEPTMEPTTAPTKTPDKVIDLNTIGYLTSLDKTHEYTVSESLEVARDINGAAITYLQTLTNAVDSKTSDDSVDLGKLLKNKQSMLEADIATLSTYNAMFAAHSGNKYIECCQSRYANIAEMYKAALQEYSDAADRSNAVNNYITKENELAATCKQALQQYMDDNHIQYTENGDQLIYNAE